MNCPFCGTMLSPAAEKCPQCGKETRFLAETAAAAEGLKAKGDRAAANADYREALAAYRAALRFGDSAELRAGIRQTRDAMERRARIRLITAGGTALLGALLIIALLIGPIRPSAQPAASIEGIPAPGIRLVQLTRKAFERQDWPSAITYLNKLSKLPDWNWALQQRKKEAIKHFVAAKLGEALMAKKSGNSVAFRQILTDLAHRRMDTEDQAVFRLRRAEGVVLFEQLPDLGPKQQEARLGVILSMFRPDELSRVYYADDCLYQLAMFRLKAGDETAAAQYLQMLIDRCPQGRWYWPAAKGYLDKMKAK